MKDYQIAEIVEIRAQGSKLDGKSDEWIAQKYAEWSQETFAAGWLCRGARMFYKWVTTAPMDIDNEKCNSDK